MPAGVINLENAAAMHAIGHKVMNVSSVAFYNLARGVYHQV